MRYARRALCCVAVAACCLSAAACDQLPFGLGSRATSSTSTKLASKSATGSVAATASASAAATATSKPKPVSSFAKEPKPKPSDPLLAAGPWGYHSEIKFERELPEDKTWGISDPQKHVTNRVVDLTEVERLASEQGRLLVRLFRNSSRVHSIISHNGGESEDTSYTVQTVDATAEMGPSTPWVTATLRATFGTPDGVKGLDLFVYRMRTRKGMDNRPYVGGAQVGFLDGAGNLIDPTPVKF